MIREYIYRLMQQKLDKKKQEVIKLRWEKDKLERLLKQKKESV